MFVCSQRFRVERRDGWRRGADSFHQNCLQKGQLCHLVCRREISGLHKQEGRRKARWCLQLPDELSRLPVPCFKQILRGCFSFHIWFFIALYYLPLNDFAFLVATSSIYPPFCTLLLKVLV